MKNIFVREEVVKEINTLITEELGVSNEVNKKTKQIISKVLEKLKKTSEKEKIEDGITLKNLSFQENIFNNELTCWFYLYNFRDKLTYDNYLKNSGNNVLDATSSFGVLPTTQNRKKKMILNRISINIISISGNINYTKLYDDVSHELMHIYNHIKADKPYFRTMDDFYKYSNIAATLATADNNTPLAAIGRLYYMIDKDERIAFANDFYSTLEQEILNDVENISNILNNNYLFDKIVDMHKTINNLKNKNPLYIKALEEFNNSQKNKFNLEKLIEQGEYALKDLAHRYGNVIIKLKKDFVVEYHLCRKPLTYNIKNDFLIV